MIQASISFTLPVNEKDYMIASKYNALYSTLSDVKQILTVKLSKAGLESGYALAYEEMNCIIEQLIIENNLSDIL